MTENTMTPFDAVLAHLSRDDRGVVALYANRLINTMPGWRPSDAARRSLSHFEKLGADEFRARYFG